MTDIASNKACCTDAKCKSRMKMIKSGFLSILLFGYVCRIKHTRQNYIIRDILEMSILISFL